MAAVPTEAVRRKSSSSPRTSLFFGRGGAGNVRPAGAVNIERVDLRTPTIKSDYYTTGRGGSGNMTKNNDPEEAREAQDVVAHLHRESESKTRLGRGGVANVYKPSQDEAAAAKRENELWERAIMDKARGTTDRGFAEKGKEWLFGGKRGKA